MKVAVIGGGIAGLAGAHRLQQLASNESRHVQLSVFEASEKLGGIIHTLRTDECVVELGPDSFTTLKPGAINLCTELGLAGNLLSTNPRNRRAFIARDGALNPIPQGFLMIAPGQFDSFFKSNILSRTGKLRMAIEQFIPPGGNGADESVASFVRRRFGPEAVEHVAQPMLGGIYTADISKLSLRSTMPKYIDYEERYGSVAAGLRRELRASSSHAAQSGGARYSAFVTLDGGMKMLPERLAEMIGQERIFLNSPVENISRRDDGIWQLTVGGASDQLFDRIILAVPTAVASRLLQPVDENLSALFGRVEYASSVVICILVSRSQIAHALDGFGFVVPDTENRSILACSFSSIKFADRCDGDQVLLRIFMGGALNPSFWQLPDDELLSMALNDLGLYIGLRGSPVRHWIRRWPQSMPQYNVGHEAIACAIEQKITRLGGIAYAGAGLRGVGLPDCVTSGEAAARAVLGRFEPTCD